VIAESTAKTHVKRVLSKIDVHHRGQAVVFAYRSDSSPTADDDTAVVGAAHAHRSNFDDLDKLIQAGEVCAVSRDKRQVVGESNRRDEEVGEASPRIAAMGSGSC